MEGVRVNRAATSIGGKEFRECHVKVVRNKGGNDVFIAVGNDKKVALSRTESATSCIQRIPSPSSPKATPKLKYSHVVESTLRPHDPGKLSPDLSRVRSRDISTTVGSCDIIARDPGEVSHDLPRDWSSIRSQVSTRSPDRTRFRRAPSPLIGTWKTVGTINKSTNQRTSHKPRERSKVAHPSPVFVPALKYGPPI